MDKKKTARLLGITVLAAAILFSASACQSRASKNGGASVKTVADTTNTLITDSSAETERAKPTEIETTEADELTSADPSENSGAEAAQLTAEAAFELWKTANTIYAEWFILPESEITDTDDCYFDEEANGVPAYRVTQEGIRTKQDLSQYLSQYFEPEVFEEHVSHGRVIERDGALYLLAGGIGSDGTQVRSIALKEQTGDTAVIEVAYFDAFADVADATDFVLRYQDGNWRFAAPFWSYYDNLDYRDIVIVPSDTKAAYESSD